jgi:hypothetical protein
LTLVGDSTINKDLPIFPHSIYFISQLERCILPLSLRTRPLNSNYISVAETCAGDNSLFSINWSICRPSKDKSEKTCLYLSLSNFISGLSTLSRKAGNSSSITDSGLSTNFAPALIKYFLP